MVLYISPCLPIKDYSKCFTGTDFSFLEEALPRCFFLNNFEQFYRKYNDDNKVTKAKIINTQL